MFQNNSADAKELLVERFGQLVYQFLEASCQVWTDDVELLAFKTSFDLANQSAENARTYTKYLFDVFLSEYKHLFSRIEAKDETLLDEPLYLFVKTNAPTKYKEASEEVRSTCWEYARQITQGASIGDVYSKCPNEMVNRVATMAEKIVKDMESGSFDMSSLNPLLLSKQMMEGMDHNEIEKWGNSLKSSGNLDQVMGMMTSMLKNGGGPVSDLMSAFTGNGSMDMDAMSNLMNGNPAIMSLLGNMDLSSMLNGSNSSLEPFRKPSKDAMD